MLVAKIGKHLHATAKLAKFAKLPKFAKPN